MKPEPEHVQEIEPDPAPELAPVPEPESQQELDKSAISSTARFIQSSRTWCNLCVQWSFYVLCYCCSGSISMEPEPEHMPEIDTDSAPESKPAPVAEVEPEPVMEFEHPALEFEPDPTVEIEQNPVMEFEPPAPEFETRPPPEFVPEPEMEFEPPMPEFEPDPKLAFEPNPLPEIEPDPAPEFQPEPVMEFESAASEFELDLEAESELAHEVESKLKPNISTLFGHKCFACFKKFKQKKDLVEHIWRAYHSVHQPKCAVCLKHFKSFESVREHLSGPIKKEECASVFSEQGCSLCLKIFEEAGALLEHKENCRLSAPVPLGAAGPGSKADACWPHGEGSSGKRRKAVALDCEMVGGVDSEGKTVDQCARICIVDEDENVILDMFVQPERPVTDYRHEETGLPKDDFKDAVLLTDVREKILAILHDSYDVGGRLLVGYGLTHVLDCLGITHPIHLQRDIAEYRPLLKTNLISQPLKYLTRSYLGYEIKSGKHSPYVDCVSAMRLYKRMCNQDHRLAGMFDARKPGIQLKYWKASHLKKMSPEELYGISKADYRCWCLDRVFI